jgi:Mg-chelatase subunit ChlD
MTLKFKTDLTPPTDTLLVLIVDRSGSMASIRHDMEGGINQLFKDQAEVAGKCFVTMSQFDTEFELLAHREPIERIDSYTLNPRGGTALLDAIGRTITTVADDFGPVPAPQVIVAIVTDGEENSSREWTQTGVKDLVERKTRAGWKFTYLGANQDAITVARGMGISAAATMDYAATTRGVSSAYTSMSSAIGSSRVGGQSINFTDQDRKAAKQ